MAIITACTAEQKGRPAVGGTGIAFLYVFLIFFAFAWVCTTAPDKFLCNKYNFANCNDRPPCSPFTQRRS